MIFRLRWTSGWFFSPAEKIFLCRQRWTIGWFFCLQKIFRLWFFQEKPEGERELEADPDLIETAGVFAEDSLVNVRKEVEGGWWRVVIR